MYLKNERGFTLAGVIIILLVLSVLGLSLTTLALSTVKVASSERKDQSVYYIAEAGLNYEKLEVEKKIQDTYKQWKDADDFFKALREELADQSTITEFKETFNEEQPKAIVETQVAEDHHEEYRKKFTITSTGKIGEKEKILHQDFYVTYKPSEIYHPTKALFVKNTIELKNGTIKGDIGTISTAEGSVMTNTGDPTVEGSIYVPHEATSIAHIRNPNNHQIPDVSGKNMGQFPVLPSFPSIPENFERIEESNVAISGSVLQNGSLIVNWQTEGNTTFTLNENLQIKDISISGDANLTLNTGTLDREIVVENLKVDGHLRVVGSGNLTIYVTNEIQFSRGSVFHEEDDYDFDANNPRLHIFLQGAEDSGSVKKLELVGSDHKLIGSVYAEDANMKITGGGQIKGNIFTGGKEFYVSGGALSYSPLLFAPHAKFKQANGTINGAIVAESYVMSGGSNLTGPISQEDQQHGEEQQGITKPNNQPEISFTPIHE